MPRLRLALERCAKISLGGCSAEQVVATHNNSLATAKGATINTILEMDWPSSDEDDGDFEGSGDDSDAGAQAEEGKAVAAGDADEEPHRKSRRVRIPSFCFCLLQRDAVVGHA